MEKSLKGTKTEQNLLKAFAGESQAKNRYEFAAKVAKEEGFEQISGIFHGDNLTAKQPIRDDYIRYAEYEIQLHRLVESRGKHLRDAYARGCVPGNRHYHRGRRRNRGKGPHVVGSQRSAT